MGEHFPRSGGTNMFSKHLGQIDYEAETALARLGQNAHQFAIAPHDEHIASANYTEAQSASLMAEVLEKYKDRAGILPTRVVVHKTSMYQPEEEKGFRSAAEALVPACDLIWMRSTAFRLIRKGMQEPWRGTLCSVGEESYFFTMGYVAWWEEYPCPHIPAPLEIGSCGKSDIRERARELLVLTKMNWNSTEGIGRYPITISFARKVGTLMTELPENQIPNSFISVLHVITCLVEPCVIAVT